MLDKQKSDNYITHMITKVVPTKRTENTYRIVLQRFDIAKNQYHDIASFRIESSAGAPAITRHFSHAIEGEFGEDK